MVFPSIDRLSKINIKEKNVFVLIEVKIRIHILEKYNIENKYFKIIFRGKCLSIKKYCKNKE